MALCLSNSNATAETLSVWSEITNEIAIQGGYEDNGRVLTNVAWTIAGDPASVKWDADDLIFTASAANLSGIQFAVIRNSVGATSGHLLCWSQLSTAAFSVTSGNTLTVQFATAGIFTLT
jgi:hypothetical protein